VKISQLIAELKIHQAMRGDVEVHAIDEQNEYVDFHVSSGVHDKEDGMLADGPYDTAFEAQNDGLDAEDVILLQLAV